MNTPTLDRIASIRQTELTLSEERERIHTIIQPFQLRLHHISEEMFSLAKERMALQAEGLLEEKDSEKHQNALTRELDQLAKEHGEEFRELFLNIIKRKEGD